MRMIFKADSTLILSQLADMKEGNVEAQRPLPVGQRVKSSKSLPVRPLASGA